MKSLPKTLVLTALSSLLFTSAVNASFSFTVDSFSDSELVVTIAGSTPLSAPAPAFSPEGFFFADTDGTSSFYTGSPTGTSTSIGTTLSSSGSALSAIGSLNAFGDVLFFAFDAPAVIGDSLPSDVQLTFTGMFDFSEVGGELGLYWGVSGSPALPDQLQDSAAVPESSSYSFVLGLVAIGAIFTSRRLSSTRS